MDLTELGRRVGGKLARPGVACALLLALLGLAELFAQTPGRAGAVTSQTTTTRATSPTARSPVAPCSEAKLHLRCPDLEMSPPYDLHIDRTSIAGHVLLRATSSLNNIGIGALELSASSRRWALEC